MTRRKETRKTRPKKREDAMQKGKRRGARSREEPARLGCHVNVIVVVGESSSLTSARESKSVDQASRVGVIPSGTERHCGVS